MEDSKNYSSSVSLPPPREPGLAAVALQECDDVVVFDPGRSLRPAGPTLEKEQKIMLESLQRRGRMSPLKGGGLPAQALWAKQAHQYQIKQVRNYHMKTVAAEQLLNENQDLACTLGDNSAEDNGSQKDTTPLLERTSKLTQQERPGALKMETECLPAPRIMAVAAHHARGSLQGEGSEDTRFEIGGVKVYQRASAQYDRLSGAHGRNTEHGSVLVSTGTLHHGKVNEATGIDASDSIHFRSIASHGNQPRKDSGPRATATNDIGTENPQDYSIILNPENRSIHSGASAGLGQHLAQQRVLPLGFQLVEWGAQVRKQQAQLYPNYCNPRNAGLVVTGLTLNGRASADAPAGRPQQPEVRHRLLFAKQPSRFQRKKPQRQACLAGSELSGEPKQPRCRTSAAAEAAKPTAPEKKLEDSQILKVLEMKISRHNKGRKQAQKVRAKGRTGSPSAGEASSAALTFDQTVIRNALKDIQEIQNWPEKPQSSGRESGRPAPLTTGPPRETAWALVAREEAGSAEIQSDLESPSPLKLKRRHLLTQLQPAPKAASERSETNRADVAVPPSAPERAEPTKQASALRRSPNSKVVYTRTNEHRTDAENFYEPIQNTIFVMRDKHSHQSIRPKTNSSKSLRDYDAASPHLRQHTVQVLAKRRAADKDAAGASGGPKRKLLSLPVSTLKARPRQLPQQGAAPYQDQSADLSVEARPTASPRPETDSRREDRQRKQQTRYGQSQFLSSNKYREYQKLNAKYSQDISRLRTAQRLGVAKRFRHSLQLDQQKGLRLG